MEPDEIRNVLVFVTNAMRAVDDCENYREWLQKVKKLADAEDNRVLHEMCDINRTDLEILEDESISYEDRIRLIADKTRLERRKITKE
jgi:hypothetical protein